MRIRSKWLTWALSALAVGMGHLLLATCRRIYLADEDASQLNYVPGPDEPNRFVMCVWHDELLVPTFGAPRRQREITCCLVSQHQDGSYLANAMALLGYSTVRGSSRRGGPEAVRQLILDTAGKHIVFTPDGPGGPRRVMKPGAVFVASQLNRRILLGAYSVTRAWRLKGKWTDMLIPKPFSTVYLGQKTTMAIPPDLSREELKYYVDMVQQKLDQLDETMQRIALGELPAKLEADPPQQAAA